MKKTIITIVVILFSGYVLQAQTARQHLGITVGPSYALSDYSKVDLLDSTSGFAKTGVGINVVYAFRMGHNLGFQFNVSYSSNNLDNIQLAKAGSEQNPNMSYSVENINPWNMGSILFGPYLRFPIVSHLSFDVRGLIGLSGVYSPDFIIRGTSSSGDKVEYYRYASKSYTFGYSIGAGFKYRIDNYYLLLFGDYGGTNAKFNHVTGIGWDNQSYDIPLAQKINSLRISIGFAYIL